MHSERGRERSGRKKTKATRIERGELKKLSKPVSGGRRPWGTTLLELQRRERKTAWTKDIHPRPTLSSQRGARPEESSRTVGGKRDSAGKGGGKPSRYYVSF